jgi:hypothetical protein
MPSVWVTFGSRRMEAVVSRCFVRKSLSGQLISLLSKWYLSFADLSKTKVAKNAGILYRVEQKVCRFNISVHYAQGMKIRKCLKHATEVRLNTSDGHGHEDVLNPQVNIPRGQATIKLTKCTRTRKS